nr:transketolase C-terminal domain-containing protein [Amycolatopsis methanolica]
MRQGGGRRRRGRPADRAGDRAQARPGRHPDRLRPVALAAAEQAATEGRDLGMVDLRSIVPFDDDTVCAEVRRTGRAVVIAEAPGFASVAAEIAARVTERCFHHLEAPVRRVTGFDVPYPAPKLEHHFPPGTDRILDAADTLQWQDSWAVRAR